MQSLRQYRRLSPNVPSPDSPRIPFQGQDTEQNDSYVLVDWEIQDPAHPRNWSLKYKIWVSALIWINTFTLDWCSSADSQAAAKIASEFGVSRTVESVASACFVYGVAIGALFAGPISETVGRNPIYIGSRVVHLAFILGTALSPNIATQISCRFLAGLGASIILAIHGASIADIFGPEGRNLAWPLVATASFLGTSFAPIPGGWIAQSSSISWRWCDWIALIMSGATFIVTFLFLPETFAPIILKWKAARIRHHTKENHFMAEIELQRSMRTRLGMNFHRLFIMATREYIVILLGCWITLLYICIYGFLEGLGFIFGGTYGFKTGLTGTSFAALAVGVFLNTALALFFDKQHRRATLASREKNQTLAPEYRLVPGELVALTLPASIFWLGWSNYHSVSPWSGLGAVALFGFSWAGIYVSIYQYIFDVYGIYAGSALSILAFMRYIGGGSVQIFSRSMWSGLGTHWTCTLLGCLALLLAPVPFFFRYQGYRVRNVSRFASEKGRGD